MSYKAALIALMLIAGTVVAVSATVPQAAAHTCSGWLPTDCGPCTTGTHQHTFCSSHDVQLA